MPPKAVHAELNEEVKSATFGFEVRTNKHGVGPETKAETNALNYVLGVLLRKLNNIHSCTVCCVILLCQSKHVVNDKQRYTAHKVNAETDTNKFCSLYTASEVLYNYIVQCEHVFTQQFAVTAHHNNVYSSVVEQLKRVTLPGICESYPRGAILLYFCRLRINFVLKFSNREFTNCKKINESYLKCKAIG